MLFGKLPFDGTSDSEIIEKIVKQEIKYPTDILISNAGYKLLNGLLAKQPKNRIEMNDPLLQEWYNDPGNDKPIIKKVEKLEKINVAQDANIKIVSESQSPRKMDRRTIKALKPLPTTTIRTSTIQVNKFKARSNSTLVIAPFKSSGSNVNNGINTNIKILKNNKK
jgi:serine/threonine protein kinase